MAARPAEPADRRTAEPVEELERAYGENRRKVYNYFRRTGLDPAAAEDLTQSTFATLLETLSRFAPERGTLPAFLFGIARNLRRVHARGRRRALVREAAAAPGPARSSGHVEDVALVRDAVALLPDDFREALVLREFHGLSYQEIAEVQSVPIGTVRSRIARARRELLARLSPATPAPPLPESRRTTS